MTTLAPPVTGVTLAEFLSDPRYGKYDELILGFVWPEMPESWFHYRRTRALERIFAAMFPDRFVSREVPLTIPGEAQLRPDLVVFREPEGHYEETGATSEDALIVVEVTLSSHERDLGPKDRQYARAAIPEYVVVDLRDLTVEVRTEPTPLGYALRETLDPEGSYRDVPVTDLLGATGREG